MMHCQVFSVTRHNWTAKVAHQIRSGAKNVTGNRFFGWIIKKE
jgi:hypothetical protein